MGSTITNDTHPTKEMFLWKITPLSVRCSKGMAALAMCFSPILCIWAFASAIIFRLRNYLKMPGVHTGPIATKMINMEPIRYWPNKRFIGSTMSQRVSSTDKDPLVSIGPFVTRVGPTTTESRLDKLSKVHEETKVADISHTPIKYTNGILASIMFSP